MPPLTQMCAAAAGDQPVDSEGPSVLLCTLPACQRPSGMKEKEKRMSSHSSQGSASCETDNSIRNVAYQRAGALLSLRTRGTLSRELRKTRGGTSSLSDQLANKGWQRIFTYLYNRVFRTALNRAHLIERLRLENSMQNISRRLGLLVCIFTVTYILMVKGGNMAAHAGSSMTLKKEFELEEIGELRTIEDMQAFFVHFTEKSQAFSPASEAYVPRTGVMTLVSELEAFSEPRVLSLDGDQLPFKSNFTLTAWVMARRSSKKSSRTLLQRALRQADGDPCWSWGYPSRLHFGAADLGFNPTEFGLQHRYFEVGPENLQTPPVGVMTHEAVTVSSVDSRSWPVARFYRDGQEVGNVTLPRAIRDCLGLLSVGHAGLEVGQLVYRPWALAQLEIEEVMRVGSTLAEIAAISLPAVREEADNTFPVTQMIRTTSNSQIQAMQDLLASRETSDHTMRDFISGNSEAQTSEASDSDAQIGNVVMNATLYGEPGKEYVQVLTERTFQADGAHLSGMPPVGVQGRGFSFSAWVRTDGMPGYIMSRHENYLTPDRCYGVHVVGNRITWYVGSGKGNMKCFIPDSKYYLNMNAFRHVAYVAKAPTTLQIFLDGELLCQEDSAWVDLSLAELDCPGPVAVGMRYPRNHLLTADVRDLRVYPEHALTREEVRNLSSVGRECRFPAEIMDEPYVNTMQRGCSWYQQQIARGYLNVCDQEAARRCPIACGRTVSCFDLTQDNPAATSKPVFIWDRVRIIKPRTLCLSSAFGGKEALEAACRGARGQNWTNETLMGLDRLLGAWDSLPFANRLASSQDVCGTLQDMVDPYCEWDIEGKVAAAVQGKRSFSLSFWRKGARGEQVFGFSGNPPHPAFGLWELERASATLDAYGFMVSACRDVDVQWSDIYNVPLVDDQWSHHVYIVGETGTVTYVLNGNIGGTKELHVCLNPGLFSALLFEKGGLVSPIQVWDRQLQPGEVQSRYYVEKPIFESFSGPLSHDSEVHAPMTVDVSNFRQRLVLLAPPIVKQRRRQQAACSEAPPVLLEGLGQIGCRLPFQCMHSGPRLTCRSEEEEAEEFFGTKPTKEGSFQVLASTLSMPAVRPREEVVRGFDFVDLQTTEVSLSAMFYLPVDLTVTVLEVTFNLETVVVRAESSVQHLSVGAVELWRGLVALLFTVLALQFLMAARALVIALRVFRTHRMVELQMVSSAFEILEVILFLAVLVITYMWVTEAGDSIKSLVHELSVIPWGDTGTPLDDKMNLFFSATEMVTDKVRVVENLRSATTMLMLILVVQMVAVLHGHPRMQMITGTLCHAFDPLLHFTIVALMLFLMFGLVGVVSFGSERPEFQDLTSGLGALFDFLMGEYPFDWTEAGNIFVVYFIAYMCVVFFLLLNFILAIIQDGYSAVKVAVDASTTEHSFPWDLVLTWKTVLISKLHRWPSSGELARRIALLGGPVGERGFGIDDLAKTGLFHSEASMRSYIIYRRKDKTLLWKREIARNPPLEKLLRMAIDEALWDVPELFSQQKAFRMRPVLRPKTRRVQRTNVESVPEAQTAI